MAIEQLITYFNSFLELDEAETSALSERFIERKIKKRQFILQEGDICRRYTFVLTGCFKMYGVDLNGKEHNLQFAAENDWISDIGSFHTEKASNLYIEALESSTILQVEKSQLIYLYTYHTKFNRIFRAIIEDKFVELQNRLFQKISSTAEERYQSFLEQYPILSNRLPNTQIASYIGITPEFLSKVRKSKSR